MYRSLYGSDHEDYRAVVREFITREVSPKLEKWEVDGIIDREVWKVAGSHGVIGLSSPEEYGGSAHDDYRYRAVVIEELAAAGATSLHISFGLQDDIVLPYLNDLATADQKQRWLPGLTSGELIGAIGMTEPAAGSDLQGMRTVAVRDGEDWVLNGQKTFISNGINADLVIVAARTDPNAGSNGISLLVVEDGMEGFRRGRKLEKIGLRTQDTAELFFDDVRVPAKNLLGERGKGFRHMMRHLPRERMTVAVGAVAVADTVLKGTIDYCFQRKAFGQRVGDFQNTRFVLAELETQIDVTRAYVDAQILGLNAGTLTATEAAKAKWWASEMQKNLVDRCLQLFGGYGYMLEYPVARAYLDSRIQTIYGGTTEIMKEIIGREIAARHT